MIEHRKDRDRNVKNLHFDVEFHQNLSCMSLSKFTEGGMCVCVFEAAVVLIMKVKMGSAYLFDQIGSVVGYL